MSTSSRSRWSALKELSQYSLKSKIDLRYTGSVPVDLVAQVTANTPLSPHYNVLAFAAPAIAATTAAGQFVMIKAREGHDPLLRRPFSVFEVFRDSSGTATGFSILNKRAGVSTNLLFQARPGQLVSILGPLGTSFTHVSPPVDAWLVAGGVGLAPFAVLAQDLRARGVDVTLFYGARGAAELFYLDFFEQLGVRLVLSTEDGSRGERGRVVTPFDRALGARPAGAQTMVYACGPEGMLEATAKVALKHRTPCEVSVERIMGCGLGGCYSCVVPMIGADGRPHHVRSCIGGPVMAGDRIAWDGHP
ncbi:MAG: dihydroorotate dehydrogenase electron transfer subunit [Acidimicrobiia bacterium]|nr:dihydroorotate dehydrogenase electron transfer subunit [Acidimicrobiia bacterium]